MRHNQALAANRQCGVSGALSAFTPQVIGPYCGRWRGAQYTRAGGITGDQGRDQDQPEHP